MAALLLARSGARVRVFEREVFPRQKLCGDTLNPGALALLASHLDTTALIEQSDPIDGMLLTGPDGVRVEGRYGPGVTGRAITRSVLDHWLLAKAAEASAQIEEGVTVRQVTASGGVVDGLVVRTHSGREVSHPAAIVVVADGRRSTLAFARRLARQPARPRRWAIGAYFTDVTGLTTLGEMHVRRGHYIGVARVPGGLTNVCLVVSHGPGDVPIGSPLQLLMDRLHADHDLRSRFAHARAVGTAVMLGPMAVDSGVAGETGLLLAGDAAGFIDPMTGDGLRLALAGAQLAARVAGDVLAGRTALGHAHHDLLARRRRAFQNKWRFNRSLRALVASPDGVGLGAWVARATPSIVHHVIRYAGDCP